MKIQFSFFRPGADRAEYGLEFEMAAVPQPGDIIVIERPDAATETSPEETFKVRKTEWLLKSPIPQRANKTTSKTVGSVGLVTVECEFVR